MAVAEVAGRVMVVGVVVGRVVAGVVGVLPVAGVEEVTSVLGEVTVDEAGLSAAWPLRGLLFPPLLVGCGLTSAGLRLLGEVTSLRALVTFFLLSPLLVGLTLPPLLPPP